MAFLSFLPFCLFFSTSRDFPLLILELHWRFYQLLSSQISPVSLFFLSLRFFHTPEFYYLVVFPPRFESELPTLFVVTRGPAASPPATESPCVRPRLSSLLSKKGEESSFLKKCLPVPTSFASLGTIVLTSRLLLSCPYFAIYP